MHMYVDFLVGDSLPLVLGPIFTHSMDFPGETLSPRAYITGIIHIIIHTVNIRICTQLSPYACLPLSMLSHMCWSQ
jgi:hypothetical protein